MSTRIGYVERLARQYRDERFGWTADLQEAKVEPFNTYVPVRVTEEPGPNIREVVELVPGVTIEEGIQFAVEWLGKFWAGKNAYGNGLSFGDVRSASHYASIGDAARAMVKHDLGASSIVGIREVPGPTVRKIEEITPEMFR